jgi:hypothetical protein
LKARYYRRLTRKIRKKTQQIAGEIAEIEFFKFKLHKGIALYLAPAWEIRACVNLVHAVASCLFIARQHTAHTFRTIIVAFAVETTVYVHGTVKT